MSFSALISGPTPVRRGGSGLMVCALLGAACATPDVTIRGRVFAAHDSEVGLADVSVRFAGSPTDPYTTVTADADGVFSALVPPGSALHVDIEGQGTIPVSFSGSSGYDEVFEVPDGVFFGVPPEEEAAWRADFAGCPRADEPGMVFGVVRLQLSADPQNDGGNPIELNGFALVEDQDGVSYDACYLDDDGVYAPEARVTGESGRFVVFGVEGGPLRVVIGRRLTDTASVITESLVYVPSGGAVSYQPAIVPL